MGDPAGGTAEGAPRCATFITEWETFKATLSKGIRNVYTVADKSYKF